MPAQKKQTHATSVAKEHKVAIRGNLRWSRTVDLWKALGHRDCGNTPLHQDRERRECLIINTLVSISFYVLGLEE